MRWMRMPGRNSAKASSRQPPASKSGISRSGIERVENAAGGRGPADDAALRTHHGERARLELGKVALGRILDQQAVEAAVVGLAHRRLDAHLRRDPGEQQMRSTELGELGRERRGMEGALARLV